MHNLLATVGISTSFLRKRVILPNFYMAYGRYGNTETKDITYQSKRTRSCSTICVQLFTHQISLTKLQCSKQKQNLMFNINHSKFPCRICPKMSMAMVKLFSVTSVNFGLILNATNLIIQITGTFKTVMNPGIVQIVAAQFFLSTPNQATNTFWLVVQTLITTSHSGEI